MDGAGDPVVATRRNFVTGLAGAEGAFVDPITGDLLLSTFGTGGRILVVRGFSRPATLRVITKVVNDDGGLLSPEDFSVHVRAGGDGVGGSPQPGSSGGSLYTLAAAGVEHTVEPDEVPRYTVSFSGDCPDGRVMPEAGVERTCTVIADDDEPTARLTVVTEVEGGVWLPEDFTVHVVDDGVEVGGSPQPGSGEPPEIPLFAGTYVVSQDGRGATRRRSAAPAPPTAASSSPTARARRARSRTARCHSARGWWSRATGRPGPTSTGARPSRS